MTAEIDFTQHTTGEEWASLAAQNWHWAEVTGEQFKALVDLFDRAMVERTAACVALCKEREKEHRRRQMAQCSDGMEVTRLILTKAIEAAVCAAHLEEAQQAYEARERPKEEEEDDG